MKKVIFLSSVFILLLCSCKRNWHCICDYSDGSELDQSYPTLEQAQAESECTQQETIIQASDPGANCRVEKKWN
ncbi:MAG: hypothetical protein MI810_20035 [Flavobacteriales bacterium]|nr:hypothetical protein [Flavobacteriales bacterium]